MQPFEFPKKSLLKSFQFQFFSDGKFVSVNHILQNFFLRKIFLTGNVSLDL